MLVVSACSYSFNQSLLDNAKSMYVQLGEDNSGEVNVVEGINDELKAELSGRNIEMRTKANSDYQINYIVLSYITTAEDFDADEEINQFSIKINAQFVLKDKRSRVISDDIIEGFALYSDDKDVGKEEAIADLVEKYITKIDNNW